MPSVHSFESTSEITSDEGDDLFSNKRKSFIHPKRWVAAQQLKYLRLLRTIVGAFAFPRLLGTIAGVLGLAGGALVGVMAYFCIKERLDREFSAMFLLLAALAEGTVFAKRGAMKLRYAEETKFYKERHYLLSAFLCAANVQGMALAEGWRSDTVYFRVFLGYKLVNLGCVLFNYLSAKFNAPMKLTILKSVISEPIQGIVNEGYKEEITLNEEEDKVCGPMPEILEGKLAHGFLFFAPWVGAFSLPFDLNGRQEIIERRGSTPGLVPNPSIYWQKIPIFPY